MSRFYLACVYGRTGRKDEAQAMWRELIEINPRFTVDHLKRTLPYADPGYLDRLVEDLRNADIAV
jgi:adenylate cyclase